MGEAFALAFQYHQAGHLQLAEQLYQQVLLADPRHADAHHLLGVLAYQTGRHDTAVASIGRAISLNPHGEVYHSNLGLALQALGRLDEAVVSFQQAVRLNPQYVDAHNALGNGLRLQGKLAEAVKHGRLALQLNPQFADAHNNLGNALNMQGKVEDAIAHYHEALRLKPSFPLAYANLGNALTSLGRFDEALQAVEYALYLQADSALAHWNRALLWLLMGDFDRGWPEYEWRWAQYKTARRHFPQPLWDGTPLAGRRILLYAEQGLGDTLQFIRYVTLIKQLGGVVMVECQPALSRLLTSMTDIDELVAQGSALAAFDVHAPLLSLPRILRTSLGTIPATVPYLRPDATLVKQWQSELSTVRQRPSAFPTSDFLIGIAWQGSPAYPFDWQRSLPLAHFRRLAEIPGVRLISLQKGPGSEQLAAMDSPILDFGPRLDEAAGPFMDTAAIMMNLDLVITSDTAMPHLAGALGVPVWVALADVPDWRWLLQREDTPWYPTMRLFRQRRPGDWNDVFQRIAVELTALVNSR